MLRLRTALLGASIGIAILGVGFLLGRFAPDPMLSAPTKIQWDFWAVIIALATLVLAALAILIAVGSIWVVVWGKPWVEQLVQREASAAVQKSEAEVRGVLLGYVGFIFGRLRSTRSDFIHEAINYTKTGYGLLPVGHRWKVRARNNLAFYYAERGYVTDAAECLALADALRKDYENTPDHDFLTTYAAAIAKYYRYSDRPRARLLEAEKMMEELQLRADVSAPDKANAARHLGRLRAALGELGGG